MALPGVLIVDDDQLMRVMLRDALADVPCVISEADSGTAGLKKLDEVKPAVVLLDLVMPGLSGMDVLTRITSQHSDIGVLVLSSLDTESLVQQALDAGARGFLVKPFHPLDVQNLVRAALEPIGTVEDNEP